MDARTDSRADDDGNGIGATLSEQRPSMYFGVTDPYPREGQRIAIASASPRIVENTAEATVDSTSARWT